MDDKASEAVISIGKRFDFSEHQRFIAESDKHVQEPVGQVVAVDLARTNFIDSAAVGMLIQLKKRCESVNKDLIIVNARGAVKDALEMANIPDIIEFH